MSRMTILGALLGGLAALGVACSQGHDDAATSSAASTEGQSEQESDFVVLDRMGRPEMTNVTIGMGIAELEQDTTAPESAGLRAAQQEASKIKAHVRAYNRQNVFHPLPGEREHAKRVLAAGIRAWDIVHVPDLEPPFLPRPDKRDWSDADIAIITDILSEDALVVDLSKPCEIDTASFFDLEREEFLRRAGAANVKPHQTCGGRVLNDDIVDEVLTMWMHKSFDFSPNSPQRVSDGVAKPDVMHANPTTTFPYLGEPYILFTP